jgi:hypothetical protein
LGRIKEGAVDGAAAAVLFIVIVLVVGEDKRVGNRVGPM